MSIWCNILFLLLAKIKAHNEILNNRYHYLWVCIIAVIHFAYSSMKMLRLFFLLFLPIYKIFFSFFSEIKTCVQLVAMYLFRNKTDPDIQKFRNIFLKFNKICNIKLWYVFMYILKYIFNIIYKIAKKNHFKYFYWLKVNNIKDQIANNYANWINAFPWCVFKNKIVLRKFKRVFSFSPFSYLSKVIVFFFLDVTEKKGIRNNDMIKKKSRTKYLSFFVHWEWFWLSLK